MPLFLVDENLPDKFSFWHNKDFIFQKDILSSASDLSVREYAKRNQLTIITKDIDFYHYHLIFGAPPKVILFKTGNMRIRDFFVFIESNWDKITKLSNIHNLVLVYPDRIETIE